jgi:glutathione S-transferase
MVLYLPLLLCSNLQITMGLKKMNTLKLVIGNKNYSSWSLRPWLFLKNLGIDFSEELVFLFEDETEKLLKPYLSGNKVPVLVDGNLQVWDSLAIIETIADKYPDKYGWPKDAGARAVARSVSAEMHSGFFALRNALPMNGRKNFPNFSISEEVQADVDRVVTLWEYCKQHYGSNGPWLFGEFSGADAMFAPVVIRLTSYNVKLTGFAKEYVEMVLQDEHMKDWIRAGKGEKQVIDGDEA